MYTKAKMGKVATLLVLTLLLLSTISFAARTLPAFSNGSPAKTQVQVTVETEQSSEGVEVEDSCEGIAEEECLMRRTLAAHLDYIYTQKQTP